MAVTSVQVGRASLLELISAGSMTVARETLYALTALPPHEPRLVDMAGRFPAYVGETEVPMSIPLIVYFRNASEDTRRAAWLTLTTYLDSTLGLVQIRWTDGGTTKKFYASVTDAMADADWSVGTANLIAPDPVAEAV